MNVLGQPAQIRILPDRPRLQEKYPVVENPQLDPRDSTSPEEILRTMMEEQEALDPADINDHIEGFHRQFTAKGILGNAPTLAQCREVAQELHDGFTTSQLENYLKSWKENGVELRTANYDDMEERFRSKLCTRSAWFTGLSKFPEEAILRLDPGISAKKKDKFLLGFDPPEGKIKQTDKQQVMERILRQAWKIRCKEEKAMEGELDILLQAEHLRLLLLHSKLYEHHQLNAALIKSETDLFTKLSEQYSAKIDVSQSKHIVRITGDYAICSDLAKLIYFMIEKIESADLELPTVDNAMRYANSSAATARGVLNDRSYVEHIEKLTSTLIKTTQSTQGNYLRVYYIGPDTTDLEDVQRLVHQLLNPGTGNKCQVQYDPPDNWMVPIQAPIEVGSAVPWTERRTFWSRWRDARLILTSEDKGRSSKEAITQSVTEEPHSLARSIGKFLSESRPRLKIADKGDHIYWKSSQNHMVSVVLGHIAYPVLSRLAQPNYIQARTYKSRKDQETRLRNAFLKTIDSRRIVVTGLPGSLGAFERLSDSVGYNHQDLRVRLKPSKMESSVDVELRALPELELRVRLSDRSEETKVESVQFIRDERESDLLLPQEIADARFRAYTFFDSKPNLDPRIIDFITSSNFDVWGESRLRTPPKLNLNVPGFVLPASVRDLVKNGEDIEVEYVFASLEHHSYMQTMHEGCRVYYNTVEAGRTGGRRTDLWLETPMNAPHSEYFVARDFVPFFNTVRNLISTMGPGALSIST
ncbi:hypothetical protein MMC11_001368 [Xylographa trunciseda]|nr:hypothetical protein [Xylographa trunciseda]